MNSHYIRRADDGRLAELVAQIHVTRGATHNEDILPRLRAVIPLVKEGAKTLLELADLTLFAIKARPLAMDAKTEGLLTEETRDRLKGFDANARENKLIGPCLVWKQGRWKGFPPPRKAWALGEFGAALRAACLQRGASQRPGLGERPGCAGTRRESRAA